MDELITNILNEKKQKDSHDRYPIRFLFFSIASDIENYLFNLQNNINGTIIPISSYFPDNRWITWESLYSKIEKTINNSTTDIIFVGLSEFLRLSNAELLEIVFTNLIGLENTNNNKISKRRCYFIMFGFETIFQKYVQNNHHRNIFYNPIISGLNKCNLISNCTLVLSNQKDSDINSVREFLDIGINSTSYNFDNQLFSNCSTLIKLANKNKSFLSDQLFKIILLDSPEAIVKSCIIDYEKAIICISKFSLMDYFVKNIDVKSEKIMFSNICNNLLSIESDSCECLLKKLKSITSENELLLLKCYIDFLCGKTKEHSYLSYMFDAENYLINNFSEFSKNVFISLKDLAVRSTYKTERLQLINTITNIDKNVDSPDELIDVYDTLLNSYMKRIIPGFKDVSISNVFYNDIKATCTNPCLFDNALHSFRDEYVLPFLTGITSNEKRTIIMLLINGILESNDVENLYPQLYGYLYYKSTNFDNKNSDITSYLNNYRESKLKAKPTDYLIDYFKNITPAKFLDFYNDSSLENINKKHNASKIFVLDGVGAEYLNLICYFLEKKHNIKISYCSYCKSVLPTITENNKKVINSLFSETIWKTEFDSEVIHGDHFKYNRNIELALTILERIIDNIVDEINGSSFLIIADHGSTASHKLFNVTKKYDFINSEHEGRCCDITGQTVSETDDYIIYNDMNSRNWALSMKPISLYKSPSHEAHGGATIEEIVVPYIYFSGYKQEISASITMIKDMVSGIDKKIVFSISPATIEEVLIIEQTGSIAKPTCSNGIYTAILSTGKAQEITIKIGDKQKIEKIKSNSGMSNGGFIL